MADIKKIEVSGTQYDIDADKLDGKHASEFATAGHTHAFSTITSRGEEYLSWGGPNQVGSVSPIGMALSSEHSANRLAFINGAALAMEYSSDGGTTWTDFGYSASDKSKLFTQAISIPVGRATGEYAVNSKTRMTLTAQNGTTGYVYCSPKKMLINISSSGGMNVLVETRSGTNYKNNGAWTTFGTYSLSGWSGWNDIPLILGTLGGGTSQTGNTWQLRLTFIMTSKNATYPTTAHVNSIRLFADNLWTSPSTLAASNHLYSIDMSQNASFPGNINAPTITENGTALSNKYAAKGSATGAATPATDSQGSHSHTVTIPAPSATTQKLVTTSVVNGVTDNKDLYTASVSGTCLNLTAVSLTTTTVATGTTSASGTGSDVLTAFAAGSTTATTNTTGSHSHTVNSHTHTQS